MSVDFLEAYQHFSKQIKTLSNTEYVPGMDAQDVAAEMAMTLYKVCQSYDPERGSLGVAWWSAWLNRRTDLIRKHNAQKRVHPVPLEDEDLLFFDHGVMPVHVPPCPTPDDPEQKVWILLALGYQVQDVQRMIGIGRKRYKRIIDGWRNDDTMEYLKGAALG